MPHPDPDPSQRGSDAAEYEWVDAEVDDEIPVTDVDVSMRDVTGGEQEPGGTAGHGAPTPGEIAAVLDAAVERLRRRRARRSHDEVERAAWQRQPLGEALYCVIDLETTGATEGRDDEILEIGAVQVNGFDLGREFSTLVDARRPISGAAFRVHGIEDAQAFRAPRLEEALPWLLETTRDRVLVFHNAGFDLGFLQRALIESGREPFTQPVLDTLVLARRLLGGRCALSTLAGRLGLTADAPHRALSDARTTALLLVELLKVCGRAEAAALGDVPAWSAARRVARRRRYARVDPLLERLDAAARDGQRLHVSYHVGAGIAPVEMHIRVLRVRGGTQIESFDELVQRQVVLDVARICNVRGAS